MGTYSRKKARIHRHKRVRAKICGTAARPRLSVFRSNKYLSAQLIDDETGTVLAAAFPSRNRGKKKGAELAKELGEEIAKAAKAKSVETLVFDRGGYEYHGNIKALAQALREQGISF